VDKQWELYRELTETPAVSGFENPMREVMARYLEPHGELIDDNLGSLVVYREGGNEGEGPKVMIAAHMDEVGWIVSHVEKEGYLRLRPLGGWWGHVMLAQRVQVLTAKGPVIGIVGSKPPHMLQPKEREKVLELEEMFVDIGVSSDEEAERHGVRPGCVVAPISELTALANPKFLCGKAWDNRAGCAAVILALQELAGDPLEADLFAGATVQEEVGLRGARTLAQMLTPDLAIAVDVGLSGDIPGVAAKDSRAKLGKGVGILLYDGSLVPSPYLRDFVIDVAKDEGIPFQLDSIARGGTDGGMFQFGDGGAPALALAIPTRYMHSHNILVHRDDILACAHLIAAVWRRLDPETVDQIKRREPVELKRFGQK
jgi:putative aminopeptidase FrvX